MQLNQALSGNSAAKSGPVLQRLRHATGDAHRRLEALPCFAQLTRPEVTKAHYVSALQALYCFHVAYTDLTYALLHNDLNAAFPPSSLGAQRIAEDLRWLGAAVPDSWPALVKPPCCAADALGALYVLEGSALGGRVIGRHVSLALGVAPLSGGSFFCSATADEARGRWQTFCAILERSAGDDDAVQRVCSAAVAAFETLEVWLAAPAAPAVQEARFAA